MSDKTEYTIQNLFEAFVYLRRQGATPDYALQYLKQMRPVISANQRDELAQLIRQWEKTEGIHHRPNPDAQIQPPPPPTPEPEPKPAEAQVKCPQCGTMNRPEARYCFSCGTLLTRSGTEQLYSDEASLNGASFGKLSSLIFTVRGFEQKPIHVNIEDFEEIIIGRTAADSVIVPDVDLTGFDSQKLGVSRVHATLKRKDTTVTISDMGSVNHTYLNGERIFPQEIRVLRDGDELRLGRMVIRISFQRELKRIK
ncbi:MAG: FHA domain-containing protein [Chloroflexi bacterium]|nr:FHA domain-containing protein [Chloroflexota bacterium]